MSTTYGIGASIAVEEEEAATNAHTHALASTHSPLKSSAIVYVLPQNMIEELIKYR